MRRRRWDMLLMITLAAAVAGCRGQGDPEKAWDASEKAFDEATTPEAKAAIASDYLKRFPDTEHTGEAADTAAYYLAQKLGRPGEAETLLAATLDRVTTPERRHAVLMARIPVLGALKRGDALEAAVTQAGDLRFSERSDVIDAAIEAEDWRLALSQANTAMPETDEAAVREAYAKRNYSAERLADIARMRRATMLATVGLAQAALGDREASEATFTEARAFGRTSILGTADTPLARYEGRALLMEGEPARALQVLSPEALFGGEESAASLHRQAYAASHGSEEGYDAYLASERERLAPTAPDFTLPDYDGAAHSAAALRGKVTLLAFWFPT